MDSRLALDAKLKSISGVHVYYQPPESQKLQYPAIKYSRHDIDNKNAGNIVYIQTWYYEITVIDKDPDSEIVKKVSLIPGANFNRHYKADGLNHDVFTIY